MTGTVTRTDFDGTGRGIDTHIVDGRIYIDSPVYGERSEFASLEVAEAELNKAWDGKLLMS